MLFNFPKLVEKHNIQFKGLIHVGAHDCSEVKLYVDQDITDVILVEANPGRAERLHKILLEGNWISSSTPFVIEAMPPALANISSNYKVFNYICCDKDGETWELNLSNYDGGLDSIYLINQHGVETSWAPFVHYDKVSVPTITLDTLVKCKENYNFLNIDVEGAELLVLQGAKELLGHVKYVLVETQQKERFDGSCLHSHIIDFLAQFGFKTVDYFDTGKGWGDVLLIKEQ